MLLKLTLYSPPRLPCCVMKAGFGATFSSAAKLSMRMDSVFDVLGKLPVLCASAISPMTVARVMAPCSNHALIVSTMEILRPCWLISVCLLKASPAAAEDIPERVDVVSDSDRSIPGKARCAGVGGWPPAREDKKGVIIMPDVPFEVEGAYD